MDAIKHYHPLVGFSYFFLMAVLSLAALHPAFQALGFLAAVGYAVAVYGLRTFVCRNWWLAILILIVTLVNGVFGGRGLTVLFVLNLGIVQTPITAESLAYGVCMGLMLASVILWFMVLGRLCSEQDFIELFAKVSPTLGMMIAQITVFIPQLLAQARLINSARQSFQKPPQSQGDGQRSQRRGQQGPQQGTPLDPKKAAPFTSRKNQLTYAGVLSSHLMEWGMEKSLITAQSMLARGYGSRKRTSFRRTRLTLRDAMPLLCIGVLGLISLVCVIGAGMGYVFYPYLSPVSPWWGYVPYLLLCIVPLVLQLREELAWWQSR